MAIHIFNLSVDTKDVAPDCIAEDLSINDQETVVEIVLEKVLGIDNAIAEQDEPDEEDGGALDFKKINLIAQNFSHINFSTTEIDRDYSPEYIVSFQNTCFDIIPRPPQA
jgi:hypothetical protein